MTPPTRRQFLASSAAVAATSALATSALADGHADHAADSTFPEPAADAKFAAPYGQPLFEISVAQWSLNKLFFDGEIDNLNFGKLVREQYGLDAVEWVKVFFEGKATNYAYLREMKQRCDDHGVKTLLVMVDKEGFLGDPDKAKRKQAVENHYAWVVASKLLGGHSIRVNAYSDDTLPWDEQRKLTADGLAQLTEFARGFGINVLVENHGWMSSNGKWLSEVMDTVALPECGLLPDFGNFVQGNGKQYDPYLGIHEMMPYAKAVSAKCSKFNANGDHVGEDFMRIMRIVLSHGYRGYVGVEYVGKDKIEGTRKAIDLLKKCRAALSM